MNFSPIREASPSLARLEHYHACAGVPGLFNLDRSPMRVSFSSRADIESSGWMRMSQDCVSCAFSTRVGVTNFNISVSSMCAVELALPANCLPARESTTHQ
jgi:hypothetical protein